MTTRLLSVALLSLLLVGCGGVPREQLSQAEAAVQATLDAWQKGQSADQVAPPTGPVQFSEDLQRRFKLSSFQIKKVEYDSSEQIIRCFTKLQLVDRRGKSSEQDAAYQVKLGPPVVVARDPYF